MKTKDELIKRLRELVGRSGPDFSEGDLFDYCGGNIDDAYSIGFDEGQRSLAEDVLKVLEAEGICPF